jgi:hypothetical protein
MDRLALTSTEASTRVGRAINKIYREVGTSIGMSFARQVATSATVTIGNPNVTFTATEKVLQVWRLNGTGTPIMLSEVLLAELRDAVTPSSDAPTEWAVYSTTSNTTIIRLNANPATAYTLYADVISEVSDLSGSSEPAFPESFHDILIEGVLKDEYRKLEKLTLAKDSEQTFQRRLSDLRMFIAKSNYLDIQQGKRNSTAATRPSGGVGGSLGGSTLTITGPWTFDRDPSAPFIVTDDSAYVANLYAEGIGNLATDKLVGRDTAGTGESEAIGLDTTLEFTGSQTIRRAALTGDVTASAGSNATTIANDAVSDAKLRNSGALSVIGRSANSSGDPADISAVAASDAVFRESGSVIGFGTIATGGIADDAVTFAKMQNISTDKLLGRDTASSGNVEEIGLGSGLEFSGAQTVKLTDIVPAADRVRFTPQASDPASGSEGDLYYNTTDNVLKYYDGGTWTAVGTAATTSPGGSDTYIQYNDAGAFGGDAGLTYNETTDILTALGGFTVGGGASAGELKFMEPSGSGSNYTVLKAQAQGGNVTYTLPAADATLSGMFLSSNAAGTMSWVQDKVVQIVNATYSTETSSSSATYADTGLTATITPTSASNKVLVIVFQTGLYKNGTDTYGKLKLKRGASDISTFETRYGSNGGTAVNGVGASGCVYLDSPATTSATTYKTQFANNAGSGLVFVQIDNSMSTILLVEVTP